MLNAGGLVVEACRVRRAKEVVQVVMLVVKRKVFVAMRGVGKVVGRNLECSIVVSCVDVSRV